MHWLISSWLDIPLHGHESEPGEVDHKASKVRSERRGRALFCKIEGVQAETCRLHMLLHTGWTTLYLAAVSDVSDLTGGKWQWPAPSRRRRAFVPIQNDR